MLHREKQSVQSAVKILRTLFNSSCLVKVLRRVIILSIAEGENDIRDGEELEFLALNLACGTVSRAAWSATHLTSRREFSCVELLFFFM